MQKPPLKSICTMGCNAQPPPETPGIILQPRRCKDGKLRTMTISLDGLLDYNEDDRDEGTFELNLFAETLKELFTAVAARRLEVPTRSLYYPAPRTQWVYRAE